MKQAARGSGGIATEGDAKGGKLEGCRADEPEPEGVALFEARIGEGSLEDG